MKNITPNPDLRAGRMFAAGRLTATFTSAKTGEHITVNAKCRKVTEDNKWVASDLAEAKVIFFTVPNESGFGDKIGKFTDGKGFVPDAAADPARVYCAKQMIAWVSGSTLPEALAVAEEERCGKCGQPLTDPVSIARGIGPDCYGASTGSKHETKVKGEVIEGSREDAALGNIYIETTPQEQVEANIASLPTATKTRKPSDGKDKQNVAYGYGDWKARKKVAQARISEDKPKRDMSHITGCNRDDLYPNGIPY